jgi:hypothetical protein
VPVTISDEDFDFVLGVLRRVNLPYDIEDAKEIVRGEERAWVILERLAAENGKEKPPPALVQRLEFVTGPKFVSKTKKPTRSTSGRRARPRPSEERRSS